jgi:2-amino-4-hydroxy-6-hydroxymethyldihydropteridine diphosphokinase
MNGERVFIGVGSNIEPHANIEKAFSLLRTQVTIVAVSTVYRSAPLLGRDIPRFLNGVWEIRTDLPPGELRTAVLKRIESECGRAGGTDKYGSRSIDLDLLLYGERVESPGWGSLPHPDIGERPFVAIPLLELDPDLILPGTGVALSKIASGMSDAGLEPDHALTSKLRKELYNE